MTAPNPPGEFSAAGVRVTTDASGVPLPVFRAPELLPRRALCDTHTTRPDPDCRRCATALEITGWWQHQQGRCDPVICPHHEFEAGDITAATHRADIG